MLSFDLRQRLGDFHLDARFSGSGRLTALFGVSGSGKSSLIALLAGLSRPDDGVIEVGGRTLVDTGRGIFVPPHRRRIGCVFQEARLFPHLSVINNLDYGRRFSGQARDPKAMARVVELLGIGHLLDRGPSALSGGEKQRVAIGRALMAGPRLLLLDEPLASLDEARKAEILPYIERLRDEGDIPIVLVSHSVAEVARLASDMVVLSDGKVATSGTVADVLGRLDLMPEEMRSEGGAVLEMQVTSYDPRFDMSVLEAAAGRIHMPGDCGPAGRRLRVRIRARDVMIATGRPHGLSALNVLDGKIAAIVESGRAFVEVHVDCAGSRVIARITRQSAEGLELARGCAVHAVVKTVSLDSPHPPHNPEVT
ncbi:molybdate transport system ATP-binding protein [Hoeflea marina]|uniref:Molybdate transport system ATP-binding protein n=2 Tax=Hoeflea marina TaxID=274592 RepID=A0A317PFV6_9HYPH|nr:molybdate transport system ATP-binding protein [Hoeflea marina]